MAKKRSAKPAKKKIIAPEHHLQEIRLLSCSATCEGVAIPPPPHISIGINIQVGRLDEPPERIGAFTTFTLTASHKDKPAGPTIEIKARFQVMYLFRSSIENWSANAFDTFGHFQVLPHVWPYWREFVQSLVSRMGMPTIRVPLLRPEHMSFEKTSVPD